MAGYTGRTIGGLNIPYLGQGNTAYHESERQKAQGFEYQAILNADLWGEGVLGSASWAVTVSSGLTVSIAAGAGFVGRFAGATVAATTLVLADDTTSYVWAVPHAGSETDQAWTLIPTFEAKAASTGYTGLLLAQCVAASGVVTVTDRRVQIGQEYLKTLIAAIAADVATIQDALGAAYDDYDPEGALDDIDARLDALEAGLGEVGATTVYWEALKRSASSTQTIIEYIDYWWSLQQESARGGLIVTDWDASTTAMLIELLRQVHLYGDNAIASQRSVYAFSPLTSSDDRYDKANSTATVDRLEGVIGG